MARSSDGSFWRVARLVASLVVLMAAAYYLIVALDNITNPTNPNGSNWPLVGGVLSGDGTPADNGFEWRFIDANWFLMYENAKWNGMQPAFQNTVTTLLAVLLVAGVGASGRVAP